MAITQSNSGSEIERSEDAIELQVVRVGAGGRPRVLTVRRFVRICHLIERGLAITEACRLELVSYSLFRLRVSRSPRLQERLKRAEDVRLNVRHEIALASIVRAGEKSWMAHAWLLERVWPHLYALRAINRDQALTEKPIGTEIPAERLQQYGSLMLEFAKENEKREAGKLETAS